MPLACESMVENERNVCVSIPQKLIKRLFFDRVGVGRKSKRKGMKCRKEKNCYLYGAIELQMNYCTAFHIDTTHIKKLQVSYKYIN